MKTLAIIGSNGMIGSDLVNYLQSQFIVTPITKKNYHLYKDKHFNIIINTNGNSKRFWANQNPLDDFNKSTLSVYKTLLDFNHDIYIYISSSDVYPNHIQPLSTTETLKIDVTKLQSYGLHKYLSELLVKKYAKNFLILRLSMTLGTKLKKGPFYDIIHNLPLFVNLKTKLQLITTRAVAQIITVLLKNKLRNDIFNVGGKNTFTFRKIHNYFSKKISILPNAEAQIYEMDTQKIIKLYPKLKTSEEYLEEFIKEFQLTTN